MKATKGVRRDTPRLVLPWLGGPFFAVHYLAAVLL